jgi:group I intron endonuclease
MLIYGKIYLITNLVNGKCYIGKTTKTINYRFNKHCYNIKDKQLDTLIINAIKKYGKENFKVEQVDVAYSKKELKLLEGVYMAWFKTLAPNGYNTTNIINGKNKLSEETKEKIKFKANTQERLNKQSEIGKKQKIKGKKYCGVRIDGGKYSSYITFNKKQIYLGNYNIESDAAKAYDLKAIELYGKDAILNFPELKQYYIDDKILINKNTKYRHSKSGIKGIIYNTKKDMWIVKYLDISLNKKRTKIFKKLEDAIKFKECI